jgi:hypothetical protein
MESSSALKNMEISNQKIQDPEINQGKIAPKSAGFNPAIVTLIAEGGANFFNYLRSLNLSKESDILVLPSNHHYYYDGNELKNVRVLINLKKLNLIKHLEFFLSTLVRILPTDTSLIGCFSDSKTLRNNGYPFYHPSRLYSRLINSLDSKTDHNLNKDEVSDLLERTGFKTVDMKEMNGLTYFCCKASGSLFN